MTAFVLLAASALPALAQEQGVRELEHYREVSPREEIPPLVTRFLTLAPENELDLGFAKVHAFLEERVVFDDNVFLADRDEESDTIGLTTPGFLSQSFMGDHRLSVAYSPTRRTYAHHPELDVWDHLADADLRLDFVDAYVRVADTFQRTQETRDIRFAGKVGRELNDLRLEAGLIDEYLSVGVRGDHRTRTYGDEVPRFEDLTEDGVGVFARYAQSRDHAWLAEYGLLFRDYRGDVLNDSATHSVLAGLEASPREDLRFLVKAGPVWVRADHDGAIGDSSDLFDLAVEGEVAADLRKDLTARLWYVQRPEFATFSNYQKVYRGGVGASWEVDPGWITVNGQLFLEKANPSNQPSLSLVGAGLSVDADLNRWCKVGVGYERRQRWGVGDLDYGVHQVYVHAVIYF